MGLSIEEARARLKKLILLVETHAHDVITEINNEADFEYTLERKTPTVHPKIVIDQEFTKRIAKKRTEIFTEQNRYLNLKRFEILTVLDNWYAEIISDAKTRVIKSLTMPHHAQHYRVIFGALILQGMCKLLENVFIIRIRQKDIPVLTSIIQKKAPRGEECWRKSFIGEKELVDQD